MNPGTLRHQVTVQSLARTADGAGGWTEAWTTAGTVWANVEPLTGSERFYAMRLGYVEPFLVRCRYTSLIGPGSRILYGGRTLVVRSVADKGARQRELEILAESVT